VPMIGPVITGLVSFLVAVSDSVSLGLYAVIFFFVIQQIEGNVLVPYIMGRAMNAHPVIVIVSMLAGAQIAGFVGIILSVPAAVLIQEIFNSLAERKDRRPQLDI
jgi:predicted PurR-regulated permease PerM